MLRKLFISLLFLTIMLFLLTTLKLNTPSLNMPHLNFSSLSFNINKTNSNVYEEEQENIYGKLIIKKLNIESPLYNIDSPKNNVDKNITILKNSIPPDQKDSIIFIAAHSGNGSKAFFKNLNKLEKKDEISLIYKNTEYKYEVKNYWETNKNGLLNVYKEPENQLILTTCSPTNKNKQLIINSIIKKK